MNKIYVGVVTYNPNINRLQENLDSICGQVQNIIVCDNGSDNIAEIESLSCGYSNVEMIKLGKNLGIAAALNRLMEWGERQNQDWMLSLDQDSVCDSDYVNRMLPYLTVEKNLGIVAPVIVDRNVGIVGHNPKNDYESVNTCITSGSFSRIDVWKNIGGYDEKLFIDSVDFEYCYRVRKKGYLVIQVRNVKLLHEIGNSRIRKFLFFKVSVKEHSAFRKYYIARNNIYYPLKHKLWLRFIRAHLRNLWMIVVILLYEKDKNEKIKAVLNGWHDAYSLNL